MSTSTLMMIMNGGYFSYSPFLSCSLSCGLCGQQHQKLGGSKLYHCENPHCGIAMDRDVNGARNILMRWIVEFPQQFQALVLKNNQQQQQNYSYRQHWLDRGGWSNNHIIQSISDSIRSSFQ
jgi:hypothetical protein